MDIDTLHHLTSNIPGDKQIQLYTWVLNICPDASVIENSTDIIKKYLEPATINKESTQNGIAQQSLLIVLCPDMQLNYVDASPFSAFLNKISEISSTPITKGSVVKFVIF